MAKGKKTGGRDFSPGHKYGKGGTHHNPEIKRIRKLTNEEISEIATLLLDGGKEELKEAEQEGTNLRRWFAKVIVTAIHRGDFHTLDAIFNRIIGKVKETVELTGKDGAPIETSEETTEERAIRLKRLEELKKMAKEIDG